jgi:hypothetical protein
LKEFSLVRLASGAAPGRFSSCARRWFSDLMEWDLAVSPGWIDGIRLRRSAIEVTSVLEAGTWRGFAMNDHKCLCMKYL